MGCRERLERLFSDNGIPFSVFKHAEAYSAQRVAGLLHIPGEQLAKVVMAWADERLVMLVLPAPYRVDLAKAQRALKASSVRVAREEEFSATFPDCDVGAMPPFGNLYGIPVYVDRALTVQTTVAFPSGSHREIMQIAYADLERTAQATVADLSTR